MADLAQRCEECGDDGAIYLHSHCHPNTPTWAVVTGDVLTIECAQCEGVVARFIIQAIQESEETDPCMVN